MNSLFIVSNALFLLIVGSTAKPMTDPNGVNIVAVPIESSAETQRAEVFADPKLGQQLEVSDDDQYEETAPIAVVAVPGSKPQVYQIVNNDQDLSASASDLEAAASFSHGGHSGWLDMGAYSSGHGAFGWYSDHPVGGHGRR